MTQQANIPLDVRLLSLSDLPAVAQIHIQAFPDSALTKLGREAVRRYYEWQMVGPHDAFHVGAFMNGDMVGFCVGGVFRGALGGFLQKNRGFLIQRVATHPWLLLNPLFRERVRFALNALTKRLRPRKKSTTLGPTPRKSPRTPSFGILSIAVAPQYQGSGAARCLMEYTEHVALERGFSRMGLTVHPANGRAVRFYEKMGWQRNTENGAWDGHMSKEIGISTPEASMEND